MSSFLAMSFCEAEDGEVVGLGAGAGENEFGGAATEGLGELIAGLVDDGAGAAAFGMGGGRVSEQVGFERLAQRFLGGRAKGGGGVVIEVDHGRFGGV
ncbi:MAG: hypothetical protein RIS92_1364 [Verrucomicrobiota bacterium]